MLWFFVVYTGDTSVLLESCIWIDEFCKRQKKRKKEKEKGAQELSARLEAREKQSGKEGKQQNANTCHTRTTPGTTSMRWLASMLTVPKMRYVYACTCLLHTELREGAGIYGSHHMSIRSPCSETTGAVLSAQFRWLRSSVPAFSNAHPLVFSCSL